MYFVSLCVSTCVLREVSHMPHHSKFSSHHRKLLSVFIREKYRLIVALIPRTIVHENCFWEMSVMIIHVKH